jgi:hypothetical protein
VNCNTEVFTQCCASVVGPLSRGPQASIGQGRGHRVSAGGQLCDCCRRASHTRSPGLLAVQVQGHSQVGRVRMQVAVHGTEEGLAERDAVSGSGIARWDGGGFTRPARLFAAGLRR